MPDMPDEPQWYINFDRAEDHSLCQPATALKHAIWILALGVGVFGGLVAALLLDPDWMFLLLAAVAAIICAALARHCRNACLRLMISVFVALWPGDRRMENLEQRLRRLEQAVQPPAQRLED